MKTIQILLGCTILAVLFQSCTQEEPLSDPLTGIELSAESPEIEANTSDVHFLHGRLALVPVIDPINDGAEIGKARLYRHRQGISVGMYTSNLIPGHTYTLWWVVYNQPENCQNVPCSGSDNTNADVKRELMYATGKVIRRGNRGYFRAYLREGDDSGSINSELNLPEFGGLLDPKKAEIHLVLRSHGPAIDGQVYDQVSSFSGGCITSLPSFTRIPQEEGECANIQFAVFDGN